jgi:PAS domain-containing protein
MFDLAPVSLWLEDYSGVRELLERWQAEGMTDLRSQLRERPLLVAECSARIRVVKVNRRTLELYGADNVDHLVANLPRVFRDDMFDQHVEELVGLWEGRQRFRSVTVNYTLGGRRLDILLDGRVLPGHEQTWRRVLVAIEDVTESARASRNVVRSERYARGLFEHSPVSLWVEDFSSVKARLDEVRAQGITDFRVFIDVHPEFVTRCMREIRVMDINQQTLRMFAAPDKETLLSRLDEVFRGDMRAHFA